MTRDKRDSIMVASGQYYGGHRPMASITVDTGKWPVLLWPVASIKVDTGQYYGDQCSASIQTEIYSEQYYQDQRENLREVIEHGLLYMAKKGLSR